MSGKHIECSGRELGTLLKRAIDLEFFPELIRVRTEIGQ